MIKTHNWHTLSRNLFFYLIIVPIMAASLIVDVRPSLHPLKQDAKVTSAFGPAVHPLTHEKRLHKGIDFRADEGTPVYATADARVAKAEDGQVMGLHIVLQHGEDYETVYAHLSSLEVRAGQAVRSGDVIGRVGNTGVSSGAHLHYEVHFKGEAVDPSDYLP